MQERLIGCCSEGCKPNSVWWKRNRLTVDTDKWLAMQLERVICPSGLFKLFGELEAKPNDACLLAKWIIQHWTVIKTGLLGYLESEKEIKKKKKEDKKKFWKAQNGIEQEHTLENTVSPLEIETRFCQPGPKHGLSIFWKSSPNRKTFGGRTLSGKEVM